MCLLYSELQKYQKINYEYTLIEKNLKYKKIHQ